MTLLPAERAASPFTTVAEDRTAAALERIATALEQMALERVLSEPIQGVGLLTGEPPLPTPPAEIIHSAPMTYSDAIAASTVPLPPVTPAPGPAIAPAFRWTAGMNHAAGHKPLKENNRGLYCPTKLPDGTWCQWAVKAG